MPDQIDLKPDSYEVVEKGRRFRRDDPRVLWIVVLGCIGGLLWVWLNRSAISSDNLVWGSAMPAMLLGGALATIFKNAR